MNYVCRKKIWVSMGFDLQRFFAKLLFPIRHNNAYNNAPIEMGVVVDMHYFGGWTCKANYKGVRDFSKWLGNQKQTCMCCGGDGGDGGGDGGVLTNDYLS